jgi:hypothetical protein
VYKAYFIFPTMSDTNLSKLSATMQTFRVTHWVTSRHNDESEIVVRCIGAIFHLYWIPQDLTASQSLLTHYYESVRILKAASNGEESENDAESDVEVAERLKQPFESLMRELAPRPMPSATIHHLHDYLYPKWFRLKATLAEDGKTIQPHQIQTAQPPHLPPGEYMHSPAIINLKLEEWVENWYSSSQVELAPTDGIEHPLLRTPSRVLVDDQRTVCYFKGFGPGYRGTTRELAAFRTLNDAIARGLIPSSLRVCRLHDLVRDTDYNSSGSWSRLVGMLFTYIKPKGPGILGTLQYVAPDAGATLRCRWADDIEATVQSLHAAGCIWGDAKPGNVLVDCEDNVWLIDFGGGFTSGWVDVEQRETLQGDLGAVKKIRAWLEEFTT